MRLKPNQKTTTLHSNHRFEILPVSGAPKGFGQAFATVAWDGQASRPRLLIRA